MREKYRKFFQQNIIRNIKQYTTNVDLDLLNRAFEFSFEAHKDQLRKSGKPYIEHSLEVAKILTELHMDYVTVAAGLLHDVVEDTGITIQEVREEFGEEIALLVDGVTKISGLHFESFEQKQAENFRKMIFSMIRDIRVIMIKFADRLHNMRTLDYLPERKQKRIALETREIYAPLAHRLGIARIKWELEDLAFRALDRDTYDELVRKVAERRDERERYINRISRPLKRELSKAGIKAKIIGRPKHLYSIYRKMELQKKSFEEIYDLLGIRIIVDKIEECYFALGIVHTMFTPIHERFKDYIATPKSNMYQSIHTTVVGPEGKVVEIQIRTEQMDRTAEVGIAAHWRYKEGISKEDELDKYLSWLRQMLDWGDDTKDPREFMEDLKISLFQDEVFVFTPKGDLIKLPIGSTPVDFAFAVHTDIGLHCIGAKVNGRIVPLNTELKSGDSVEIITSAKQRPNPDWLKFVKTSKARSKIKKWIKDSLFEQSLKLGKEILEKGLKKYRLVIEEEELKTIAQSMGFPEVNQLYAALGRGEIALPTIIKKLLPKGTVIEKGGESLLKRFIFKAKGSAEGIRVDGINNMLITFAKCCQPVPGDKILGFVTKGRGIVIHRADCTNILRLMEDPERSVEVEWDVSNDKHFTVRLRILAEDRKGLLRDVAQAVSATDTNIISVDMKAEDSLVTGNMIIEVKDLQHLTRVVNKIDRVKGVITVERLSGLGGEHRRDIPSVV